MITVVLGVGITQLEFATGQDSYLNKDEDVYKNSVAYQDLFGGQAMVTLVTLDDGHDLTELFTPENVEQWKQIEAELKDNGGDQIFGVVTPLTALQFTNDLVLPRDPGTRRGRGRPRSSSAPPTATPPRRARRRVRRRPGVTLERVNAIPPEDRVIGNPAWNDFLLHDNEGEIRKSLRPFFPTTRNAQMVVRLPGNLDIETEGKAAELVQDATADLEFEGATMTTTGAPVLLRDINDYLTGGMLVLGAIAVGLMVIILLVAFDVRWRLLPLGVVLIGVVWAFGLAGYLGIPLTIVTIAGLPVMLGVGIDYAIQMHARDRGGGDHRPGGAPDPGDGARTSARRCSSSPSTPIFAFLALRFAKVPMIRDFGLLLAVGIAVICLCSIIGPLAALGIREYKSPTKGKDFREGALGRLVVRLGGAAHQDRAGPHRREHRDRVRRRRRSSRTSSSSRPIRSSGSTRTRRSSRTSTASRRRPGRRASSGMFVQSRRPLQRRDRRASSTASPRSSSTTYPEELLTASSIVTTVSFLMEIPGAGDVAPTGEEVAAAFAVAPRDIQLSTANDDEGALNLIFRTGAGQPRGAGRGRARDPRHRRTAGWRVGHPVGPRRGRRRPARQPRGQPHPAHLPGHPVRVPLPRRCGCAASCGRCCRWCPCSSPSGRRRWWRSRST